MKFHHVADVVVKFYKCVMCVNEVLGGLNTTTIRQYLRNSCRKIALLKSLNFATSKESNFHSFRATGLMLVSKYADFCDLQSYREFFLQFPNPEKKLRRLEVHFLRQKYIFLKKSVQLEN